MCGSLGSGSSWCRACLHSRLTKACRAPVRAARARAQGGNSSSGLAPSEDGAGAVWSGDLVLEGGGFCGTRTKRLGGLDLSRFDGLQLRVKGDGQIFKFNIKTVSLLWFALRARG